MKMLLYVDDSDDDRFLLESAARLAGVSFTVKTAESGAAAIRSLGGKAGPDSRPAAPLPDLIFLDVKMPEMDGFQVLQWLRSNPPTKAIPIALFSASIISRDIERGYAEGANYFITKPPELVTLVEIMRAADRFLAGASAQETLGRFSAPDSRKQKYA